MISMLDPLSISSIRKQGLGTSKSAPSRPNSSQKNEGRRRIRFSRKQQTLTHDHCTSVDKHDKSALSPNAKTVINHSKLIKELIFESKMESCSQADITRAMFQLTTQIGEILTRTTRSKTFEELRPRFEDEELFEEMCRVADIGYLFKLKIENTVQDPSLKEKRERMERRLQDLRRTIGSSVSNNIRFKERRERA